MPQPRVPILDWDDDTHDHLAAHRLTVSRALQVANQSPVLIDQKGKFEERLDGTVRWRRARLRMVGPDNSGRLLTFVIEYPDSEGKSKIVTGWDANDEERAQYRQRGGGRRR